jgi:predicted RNA methylase
VLIHTRLMQNTSHAVMAQRSEPRDSLDDFPTPPWATRALIEHVIARNLSQEVCLEPACGAGHMSRPLNEYIGSVESQDVFDYGFGSKQDYLSFKTNKKFDWVITNPPFRLAEEFILQALSMSKVGCAFLVRTTFIESVGRYRRLFNIQPPALVAQFVERVPMVKGRLDPKASTATGYCWLVWERGSIDGTKMVWIPPCRKSLEFEEDYPTSSPRLL